MIVVGTYIDKMQGYANKREVLEKIERDILRKYSGKVGFPRIARCVFVSNKTREGIQQLRQEIYEVTSKMNREEKDGFGAAGKQVHNNSDQNCMVFIFSLMNLLIFFTEENKIYKSKINKKI